MYRCMYALHLPEPLARGVHNPIAHEEPPHGHHAPKQQRRARNFEVRNTPPGKRKRFFVGFKKKKKECIGVYYCYHSSYY